MPPRKTKSISETHPRIAASYSSDNTTPVDRVYSTSRQGVHAWKCLEEAHYFHVSVRQAIRTDLACSVCKSKELLRGFNDLQTRHPDLAGEWSPKNENPPEDYLHNSGVVVWWEGRGCGHSWDMAISARTTNKQNCPYCSGQRVQSGINDLASLRPELALFWDYEKNTLAPTEVTPGSRKLVWWKCENGEDHSYSQQVKAVTSGYRCSYCSGHRVLKGFNDFATKEPELAETWSSNNEYGPETVTVGSNKVVSWDCRCGRVWKTAVKNRRQVTSCLSCSSASSFLEEKVVSYLKEISPETVIVRRARCLDHGGKKLELDIFLPDYSVAIEVQDFATHSRDSDCEVSTYRRSQIEDALKKGPEYHELKRKLTREQLGVTLVDLWEDEIRTGQFRETVAELMDLPKILRPEIMNLGKKEKRLLDYLAEDVDLWRVRKDQLVNFRCPEGHEFKATKKTVRNSVIPCPYCRNSKLLKGFNDVESVGLSEQYSTLNSLHPSEAIASPTRKYLWVHEDHTYSALVSAVLSGRKCNKCYGSVFDSAVNSVSAKFPALEAIWGRSNPASVNETRALTKSRVFLECTECGAEVLTSISRWTETKRVKRHACSKEL